MSVYFDGRVLRIANTIGELSVVILVCYYDDKSDEFVFTKRGDKQRFGNAKGVWRITTRIEGYIPEDHLSLLDNDEERHYAMQLADATQHLRKGGEEGLLGNEVYREVTRVTHLSKRPFKTLEPELQWAFQDIIAGFSAYTELEIKVHRLDFNSKRKRAY